MAKTFKEEETDTAETAGGVEGGEETAVLAGEEAVVFEVGHGGGGGRGIGWVCVRGGGAGRRIGRLGESEGGLLRVVVV